MKDHTETNRLLLEFVVLPTILLSVALLGGLRIDVETHHFIFIAPSLVTLILAVLLMALFVRAGALELTAWLAIDQPLTTNVSHLLTLIAFFFASAQAFNSVLPESGLLHWMFSFFFLWTLWTNQFSAFDARRLLRSLVVLFGTAFVLKHMLMSAFSAGGGWVQKLTAALLQGIAIDVPHFAPATGYISFLVLVLFMAALWLTPPGSSPTGASDFAMTTDNTAAGEEVKLLPLSIDGEVK
jgi:hypothetical protein